MSRKTLMTNIAYDTERRRFYVTLWSRQGKKGPAKRTVRCVATLEEARRLLARHTAGEKLSTGRPVSDLTVGQWLDYWLDRIITPSRAASTVHGYGMIVHNHLLPGLGDILLEELTAAEVQEYLNGKLREGLCNNTVRKHYSVLHSALEQARRERKILVNVVEQASRPAQQQPAPHYYDSENMSRLFEALRGTPLEPVVKLAGYLGLRRSEICGLKWGNVDRQNKVITIAEARTAVNGRAVDKETKNTSSVRRLGYGGITDLEEMMDWLWRSRQAREKRLGGISGERDFVICHNSEGKPYQPDYLSNRLREILEEKKLPYVTLHGLRHSFASIAHSRNVPLFGISKALGHSSTSITAQIYMHLFDDTHLSVVQEVSRAIGGEEM